MNKEEKEKEYKNLTPKYIYKCAGKDTPSRIILQIFTYLGLDGGDHIHFDNNATMRFTVNGNEEMRLEADGDLHADGDVIAYSTTISDETLKYNINPVEFALDKINNTIAIPSATIPGATCVIV